MIAISDEKTKSAIIVFGILDSVNREKGSQLFENNTKGRPQLNND